MSECGSLGNCQGLTIVIYTRQKRNAPVNNLKLSWKLLRNKQIYRVVKIDNLTNYFLNFHHVMSIQNILTRLRTRQGSVFNITVFNNMCDPRWLMCIRTEPMVSLIEFWDIAFHSWCKAATNCSDGRCTACIRANGRSHILLNTVTLKTDPCHILRRVKKYWIVIM